MLFCDAKNIQLNIYNNWTVLKTFITFECDNNTTQENLLRIPKLKTKQKLIQQISTTNVLALKLLISNSSKSLISDRIK